MKKIMIAAAMLLALVGCGKAPETAIQVNSHFQVDTLFTHKNCTVYRFSDAGNLRYYTDCKGSVEWKESCGKNCNRDAEVLGGKHE